MASTTAKSHGKAARIAIITISQWRHCRINSRILRRTLAFQDKVPGVHLGNVSVMGQTREELNTVLKQQLNSRDVHHEGTEGNSVKASLKDLGVTVDTDKTS